MKWFKKLYKDSIVSATLWLLGEAVNKITDAQDIIEEYNIEHKEVISTKNEDELALITERLKNTVEKFVKTVTF